MGYVETLFGHQAPVLAIDALRGETAVSTGGRDKSVRFWKIPEETLLVFRGGGGSKWMDDLDGMEGDREDEAGQAKRRKGKGQETTQKFVEGSIECVAMIDENTFVSGGDSGCVPRLILYAHVTYTTIDPLLSGQHKRRNPSSLKHWRTGSMNHTSTRRTCRQSASRAGSPPSVLYLTLTSSPQVRHPQPSTTH